MELVPQYLALEVSYTKFSVNLSIDDYSTHNNEQSGGCFIKIKQLLISFTGFFNKVVDFQVLLNWMILTLHVGVQYLALKISYLC